MSAASGLALFVCMFFLAWYDVDGIPGQVKPGHGVAWTENAWHGLSIVRWIMLATILAAVGGLALHWRQRAHGARTSTGGVITALGAATAALLVYRVLINPPAAAQVPDQKLGALLGLLCAMGIALGGLESVRAERRGDSAKTPSPGESSTADVSRIGAVDTELRA